MKQLTLLALALLHSGFMFAQTPPANDNCDGLIPLGTAPTCPTTVFSNENATPSNIGTDNFPTCFNSGIAERDVWFSFQCPSTVLDWRITLTGIGANSIVNPEVAIYRGDCELDGFSEYLCASAQLGDNTLFIDMLGLSPGATYFVRVSDYSATASPNSGEFTLCVDEIPPIVTIDGGSSTLCEGTIFDDGGPDGDYTSEDHVFTICPSSPTKCITFTLSYYNLDAGDFLNIYAGSNTTGTLVQSIGGTTPITSGGGVCIQTQVAANCMTLQFLTDATVAFEGFQGTWECSPDVCPNTDAPITIDDNITQQDIADFVKTPFTDVTVTNVNCEQGAYGTFSYPSASNDLELERGLLLTSGDASSVANPGQIFLGSLLGLPGDPDLDAISTGLNTQDACVVEVDVYAATDELSFEYVFGSEEYPEFVNSDYNDIFALLISGPGIVGDPAIGGQKNLAVLPGSNTPVEINSVNNLENWQYYRDNTSGPNLVYDGLTSDFQGVKKSLTARQIVTPCNLYHLKFAIADRGDANYDSGVFLSKIQGGGPKVSLSFTSGIPYLVESCTNQPDQLVIQLSQPKDYAVSYLLTVGGNAQNGVDYQITVPDTITFLPGQTQFTFPILPIADNLVEGIENITFSLTSNFGCGAVTFATVTVEIHDNIAVEIVGNDSLKVCEGFDLQLNVTGAAQYFWSPAGAVSNPFSASPILEQPANSLWLEVTGNVGICVDKDSVFVEVVKPDLTAMATTPTNICLGSSVQLQASSSNSTVVWSPTIGLTPPNAASPLATPTTSTTYVATVDYKGCVESIPITINVDTLFNPTLPPVVSLCQNYSVVLGPNLNNSSSTYAWSPTTGLSNPMVSNPVASPDVTTPYVLTTTSANGYCSATSTITVNVTAADVEILGDEKYKICLGDTLNLAASLAPTTGGLTWEPAGIFTSTSVQTVLAHPSESVTVFARYQVNGCTVVDSVQIRVDSLPDLAVMKDEDKPVYCQGDTIYLTTPPFDTGEHPNPSYGWLPGPGQISQMPEKSFSLVIVAVDSFTYRRHIKVGGCKDTTDVFIPVQKPPTLTATANPEKVCPGELIQLGVTADQPNLTYEWLSPADPTISCTDCPNPTVQPAVSGFYQVKVKDHPCPAAAMVSVTVLPLPQIQLAPNPVICPGETVTLNNIDDPNVDSYNWTSEPAGFTSTDAQPMHAPAQTTKYLLSIMGGPTVCSLDTSLTVTVAQATINAGADQELCEGEPLQLAATTTGDAGFIYWLTPDSLAGNNISFNPVASGTILSVLEYGPLGRCRAEDSFDLTVFPGVVLGQIGVTAEGQEPYCAGIPVTLKITAFPDDVALIWLQNGAPLEQTADSIVVRPNVTDGSVTYTVQASTTDGCTATSLPVEIAFQRCLYIPNAFTPNGDSNNDTFGPIIPGGGATVPTFMVFNRWGKKVFESSDNSLWDGKIDGKEAPVDVYVWYAVIRYRDGQEETRKGEVTLIR